MLKVSVTIQGNNWNVVEKMCDVIGPIIHNGFKAQIYGFSFWNQGKYSKMMPKHENLKKLMWKHENMCSV